MQRHLEKLPSLENGDELYSSGGDSSDEADGKSKPALESNEIIEKVFRGYDLNGFSFPPPSTTVKGLNNNSTNGIGTTRILMRNFINII